MHRSRPYYRPGSAPPSACSRCRAALLPLLLLAGAVALYTFVLPLPRAAAVAGAGGAAGAELAPPGSGATGGFFAALRNAAPAAGAAPAPAPADAAVVAGLREQVAALQASSAAGAARAAEEARGAHDALLREVEELKRAQARDGAEMRALREAGVLGGAAAGAAPGAGAAAAAAAAAAPCAPCAACDASAAAAAARPQAKSAILGMAQKIPLANAHQFVRSLRAAMPADRVDVFLWADAASLSPEHELVYAAHGVTVVLFDLERAFPGDSGAAARRYHPSSFRWILMRDFLLEAERAAGYAHRAGGAGARGADGRLPPGGGAARAAPPYEQVMFVDVRDTVWQADVFARARRDGRGEGVTVFMEQRPRTIAECGWNSKWVAACFGEEGLRAVGGGIISCSGTTLATWDDAVTYAQMVGDLIAARPDCEQNGIDQGIHNYILHSGRLAGEVSKVTQESNEEGFVATMQTMPVLLRDRLGRVLNSAGTEVVAAVHQVDRSPVLVAMYERMYPFLSGDETRTNK